MAALILVKPDVDWQASSGLFDFAVEFLIPRMSDRAAADWMRTVVDNNLGSLWLTEFSAQTQREVFELWRAGLLEAAERSIPDSPGRASALAKLQELVDLTADASP